MSNDDTDKTANGSGAAENGNGASNGKGNSTPAASADAPKAAAPAGDPQAAAGAQAAVAQPGIRVLGQYIKDLSFENPAAPQSLAPSETTPNLDVNVNVNARGLTGNDYEIELKLEATAKRGDQPMFVAEVTYAGVFQIQNAAQEHLHPILLIECPRLLFPFARQILADATRQGGFPPLMVDPVDFAALYRQRAAEMAQKNPAASAPSA
ncbi:MAG: protein-export chaperone SecB [Alphaproteobacteria bacterium]